MIIRVFVRVAGNSLALYAATRLVSGFTLSGGWQSYLSAALVLMVLNWTIKPLLKLISFPLIILTLGLFTLAINAGILWLLDRFFAFITIADLFSLFWATLVITIINLVISRKL